MRIQGTHIVVTPEIIFEVLHILRESHPDYPSCPHLRTMSKDELLSFFCKTPSLWGDRQNSSYSGFAKVSRFLNMVMTFFLHPLSHYNSITEPRAQFLLSLIEDLTIDFPSHFIFSLIDVYKDTATLSLVFSLHCHGCHQRGIFSTKRGPTLTKVATDQDGDSSSPFHSIHLRSFFFFFCG